MHHLACSQRDRLLKMTDSELLNCCRVSTQRGSGRGGQKRNTVNSAVHLALHDFPDVSVSCDDTRSQQRNRTLALRRLRLRLALRVRRKPIEPAPAVEPKPNRKNPAYPVWTAQLLDWLEECDYQVGAAARQLGFSTGRLVRLLTDDPAIWRQVNQERTKRDLKPLKA